MNLSEEYIELMKRLLGEGQKHGVNVDPIEALILAACYGPEIKQSELDLIQSTAENAVNAVNAVNAMKELKIPANEMKANLTSTLVKDGFTIEEAKVISGEEDPK